MNKLERPMHKPSARRVRYKTHLVARRVENSHINPAPEGPPTLAQRFSDGLGGRNDSSPGGTAEFRKRLRRPPR